MTKTGSEKIFSRLEAWPVDEAQLVAVTSGQRLLGAGRRLVSPERGSAATMVESRTATGAVGERSEPLSDEPRIGGRVGETELETCPQGERS
jgi:hypothetical protein